MSKEIIINNEEKQTKKKVAKTVEKLISDKDKNVEVVKETKPTKKPVTMVKILLRENHRCNIGGNWYTFKAGKQYNVPENVKDILLRAGKLLPL